MNRELLENAVVVLVAGGEPGGPPLLRRVTFPLKYFFDSRLHVKGNNYVKVIKIILHAHILNIRLGVASGQPSK